MTLLDKSYEIARAKQLLPDSYRRRVETHMSQVNTKEMSIEDIEHRERTMSRITEKARRIESEKYR